MMKTCMTYMSVLSNDDKVQSDKYHKSLTQRVKDVLAQVIYYKILFILFFHQNFSKPNGVVKPYKTQKYFFAKVIKSITL